MAGRTAAAAVACALLALTGCTGSRPAAGPEPSPSTTSAAPSPATATPTVASTPTPSGAPSPGSMATPARTSGPLSQRSFPTPRQLGAGWKYAVDPGDAEEGYAGNGSPVVERYPQEISDTAVPFGCDRRWEMPPPRYALEVDYTFRGRKAIAVRGKFRDNAAASTFFEGRSGNLRACLGRSGSTAIGPLVTSLRQPAEQALASARTPESDPWRELSVLDRDTVVLLAVQGAGSLTDAEIRRLVALFRR